MNRFNMKTFPSVSSGGRDTPLVAPVVHPCPEPHETVQ